jgi:hypothetical protein
VSGNQCAARIFEKELNLEEKNQRGQILRPEALGPNGLVFEVPLQGLGPKFSLKCFMKFDKRKFRKIVDKNLIC